MTTAQTIRQWLRSKPLGDDFRPAPGYPLELREFANCDLDDVYQYQRRLPHWELAGSTYFITFRVSPHLGSPFATTEHRNRVGQAFQPANPGPQTVGQAFQPANPGPQTVGQAFQPANPGNNVENPAGRLESLPYAPIHRGNALADIVEESLFFGHGQRYFLDAYVIMPDHVHTMLTPLPDWTLAKIQQGIKGFTSREINKQLGRHGAFWQPENFDHLVRNDVDWLDKLEYIHNNPVTAGLVERSQDYPYSSLITLHSRDRRASLHQIVFQLKGA